MNKVSQSLNSFDPLISHFQEKQFVETFFRDRMIDFHETKCKLFLIYVVIGLRVAILRFLCVNTFSMLETLKIREMEKIIAKKSVFAMKKVFIHRNLKISTLRPITIYIRNNLHFVL